MKGKNARSKQAEENEAKYREFRLKMAPRWKFIVENCLLISNNMVLNNTAFMEIYTEIYMIDQSIEQTPRLLDEIHDIIRLFAEKALLLILQEAEEALFKRLALLQAKLRLLVHWLVKLFHKLRFYIETRQKCKLEGYCFRKVIELFYNPLSERLRTSFVAFVDRHRNDDLQEFERLREVVLELYNSHDDNLTLGTPEEYYGIVVSKGKVFESKLVNELVEASKASVSQVKPSLGGYEELEQFIATAEREHALFGRLFDIPSKSKAMSRHINEKFVIQHQDKILGLLRELLLREDWPLFARLHRLAAVGDPRELSRALLAQIEAVGIEANEQLGLNVEEKQLSKDRVNECVSRVSEFCRKFDGLLGAIDFDISVGKCVETALQTVVSKHGKFVYCLVIFLDIELKKEEADFVRIQTAVKLFSYLLSRDMFFKLYARYFAQRLLTSISQERLQAEVETLRLLKAEAGPNILSKLFTMLRDIDESSAYEKSLPKPFMQEVNCVYLTKWVWPITSAECSAEEWPEKSLRGIGKHLEEQFAKRNHGKNITWAMECGSALLQFNTQGATYFLSVSTPQMFLLLQFNENSVLTREAAKALIKAEDAGLWQASIENLVRLRVLLAEGPSLRVNAKFSSKQMRVVCMLSAKISEKEKQGAKEELTRERELAIDAALVKIMKTKRKVEKTQLLTEAAALIRTFKADPEAIAKRVESLIERQFLAAEGGSLSYVC